MNRPAPRTEYLGSPYGIAPELAECPVAYCLVRPDRLEEHVKVCRGPEPAEGAGQ